MECVLLIMYSLFYVDYSCMKYDKTHMTGLTLPTDNLTHFFIEKMIIINKNIPNLNNFAFENLSINVLELSYNEIEHIEENSFSNMKDLSFLIIKNNKIKSIVNIIKSLEIRQIEYSFNLNTLDFSNNLIETFNLSFNFSELFSIKHINLDNNRISFIDKNLLEYSTLISISLKGNLLTLDKDLFTSLTNLKTLILNSCGITEINSNIFNKKVEILDLETNRIKHLNKTSFNSLENLYEVFLSNNLIESIESETFKDLVYLKVLYLSNNYLQVILSDSFVGLTKLKVLKLDQNKLKLIEPKAFVDNHNLNLIDLRFNNLESLPNDSFFINYKSYEWNCTFLLNFNKIDKISNLTFGVLQDATKIELISNSIKQIEAYSFHNFKKLKTLNISESFIEHLDKNSFYGLSLKLLILSSNRIQMLKNEVFNGLSCSAIDLCANNIRDIEAQAFNGVEKLTKLDLSKNFIKSIESKTFSRLESLNFLDLSKNIYVEILANNFIYLNNLKLLNLSSNKINKIVKDSFNGLSNLDVIDLSNNFIEFIKQNYFINLTNLKVFNISHNRIYSIQKNFFSTLINLKIVDLSFNKLSSLDILLPHNLTSLNLKSNQIMKNFVHLNKLIDVDLSDNCIENVEFKNFERLKNLNAHGNRLSSILLKTTFIQIEYLNLSLNQIIDIDFISNIKSLTVLDLSKNKIENIKRNYFSTKQNLSILDLSNNNIKFIEPESFFFVSKILKLSLSNISFNLDLTINFSYPRYSAFILTDLANNKFQMVNFLTQASTLNVLNISNSFVNEIKMTNKFKIVGLDLSKYKNDINKFMLKLKSNLNYNFYFLTIENMNLTSSDLNLFDINFSYFNRLDLSSNHIESVYSFNFYNFKSLKELDLSSNRIEFIQESTFLQCTYLNKINLMKNRLKSLDFYLVSPLFEDIKLSFNQINYFNIEKISSSINILHMLDFSNNKISTLDFLEDLLVHKTKFMFKDVYGLISFKYLTEKINLKSLILSENTLRNISHGIFRNINYLIYLDLSSNLIDFIESNSFKFTPLVEFLNLSNNKLSYLDQDLFNGLSRTEYLNLSHNQINYLSNHIFDDLKNLKSLDLSTNNLKQISKTIFSSLSNLNYLYLSRNKKLLFDTNCFINMKSINNIVIDYEAILNEENKDVLVRSLQLELIKNFSYFNFYKAINLIYKDDSIINCTLTLIYIKYNVLVNLINEKQVELFLKKCQNLKLFK